MNKILSPDIETYGILEGQEQRYFHPLKSAEFDGVPLGQQIVSVSLTWREGDHSHSLFRSGIFLMNRESHRNNLWRWLSKAQSENWTLLGQNLTFDLLYLRANHPEARWFLKPPLRLMDLMIANYLHDEARPERSLKDIAPLMDVTKYKEGFRQYKSVDDPDLWRYNCQDTEATYRVYLKLAEAINGFYGDKSAKLSPFCLDWYNQLLWLVLWMSEDGVTLNRTRLHELGESYVRRLAKLESFASAAGLVLSGKGSETCKRKVMQDAVTACESLGIPVPVLKFTDKTAKIAFKDENRNALMDVLPRTNESARHLRLLSRVQDTNGLLDKYTKPLLHGRLRKGVIDRSPSILSCGQVFPTIFPVPGEYDDGSRGGTKQSRLAFKNPPVPTFPKRVKACITGRFPGGHLVWYDLSQIELRIAALLSGDQPMMTEYMGKPDLHTQTAKLIFGDTITNTPDFKNSKYRQAGKTLNFLMLYRGGARKFQETMMRDIGIYMTVAQCQQAIDKFWYAHPELRAWQDGLIAEATAKGYIELPLIGQSRLFLGGASAIEDNVNEIVNLPVQAIAANVMLSGQFEVYNTIRDQNLRTRMPLNVYDAAALEVPPLELDPVLAIMKQVVPNPPFYSALCKVLGRTLPIEYDVKVTRT